MSKPFDSAMKEVMAISPSAWLRFLGHPAAKAAVENADIATVTGAVDFVIRIDEPVQLYHLEFQAGADAEKPRSMNLASAALERKHRCPVASSLILLRKEAYLRSYTGLYEMRLEGASRPYRTFWYDVVKLWELDPKPFMTGDITLLPLVPLMRVERKDLSAVVVEMSERLQANPDPSVTEVLLSATDILMKLRYTPEFIQEVMMSDVPSEHSQWYLDMQAKAQQIAETRGRLAERRDVIRQLGEARFGQPAEEIQNRLETISVPEELREISMKLLTANSWEELFVTPKKKASRRKKG